jgi:hypothetical protein
LIDDDISKLSVLLLVNIYTYIYIYIDIDIIARKTSQERVEKCPLKLCHCTFGYLGLLENAEYINKLILY